MFKNLIIYRLDSLDVTLDQLEDALQRAVFIECAPTQKKSTGWVPPRGEAGGALVESVGGQWIARFAVESRTVPGEALQREVDARAKAVEAETGRCPGKKERRELREDALMALLPHAFSRRSSTWAWIDRAARILVVDTSSQARADDVVSALVDAVPGLALHLVQTRTAPQAAMAHWLKQQEPPEGFTVDRECELKSEGEEKAVVRYARHPLDIQEVQGHIAAGKLPTKLALTWDDRVSFLLTEQLQLRKVQFLDCVFEGRKSDDGWFDTEATIATGELARLIPDLIGALDGEGDAA